MISRGVRFMILAMLLLAGQHVLVKELSALPVAQLILFRGLISLSICSFFLYFNNSSFKGNNYSLLTVRGIIGTASLASFFYTIHNMPLASAITISYLSPIFLGGLAVYFLKEKLAASQGVSLLISFSGVVMLKGFDTRITFFELWIAVLSALLAALAHFFVRKLKGENPLVVLFYFSLVIIPAASPFAIMNWVSPDASQWALLILFGIVSHTGQYYLTKAFKAEEVTKVSGIYYLGILISVALGYFLFNETFSFESYLGMLLIILGVFYSVFFDRIASFLKKTAVK